MVHMLQAVGAAEKAYESNDFEGAASAAAMVMNDSSAFARAAVVRGKSLLAPVLQTLMNDSSELGGGSFPSPDAFREPHRLFSLATRLDPENAEARDELEKVTRLFDMVAQAMAMAARAEGRGPSVAPPPPPTHPHPFDVIIVGAGASGIGMALMLTRNFGLDPSRVVLVERGEDVGETFRRWPKEMRFISPSFNNQGWTGSFDLNSIAYGTSPAFTLLAEHPTGEQYAFYLKALADAGQLRIQFNTEVRAVNTLAAGGFEVETSPLSADAAEAAEAASTLRSPFVVWAAGEFQYARGPKPEFPGSDLCMHNSSVRSWEDLPGDDYVVIGGYESGMDAAFNLASREKRCTVVSSTAFWKVATDDPSTELAPYTAERVRTACTMPVAPRLLASLRVRKVEKLPGSDAFLVHTQWGAPVEQSSLGKLRLPIYGGDPAAAKSEEEVGEEGTEMTLRTPQAPLLCTGFQGSCVQGVAKDLFEWGDAGSGCAAGSPLLNDHDESTKTPGLFLVGPAVRHGELSFCFVYKFRQRFGIVADAIVRRLGRDTTEAVEACRKMNMYLDDLECCKGACGESC